ncbi:MAG TPA: ChaN family lipoprotein [Pyrinomonadaceae bacterium]
MLLALFLLASLTAQASPPSALHLPASEQAEARYRIYDATGKAASIEDVLAALDAVEVVFVGEQHDDAAGHAFEAELLRRAFERYNAERGNAKRRALALSLEMFERDAQIVLDEYLRGLINESQFLSSSRPWNNYRMDYRPLVEYARERNLAVIAANAPARYVNRVARLGPESLQALSAAAKEWLPPLPFATASRAYAAKFNQLMSGAQMNAGGAQGSASSPHAATYLLDAQTLRDATMAYAVAQQLKRQPAALVLHVNGNFHSEERLGVPEQLLHYRPKTRSLIITIVSDESYPNFDRARFGHLGDFIIMTDPALPRSFQSYRGDYSAKKFWNSPVSQRVLSAGGAPTLHSRRLSRRLLPRRLLRVSSVDYRSHRRLRLHERLASQTQVLRFSLTI